MPGSGLTNTYQQSLDFFLSLKYKTSMAWIRKQLEELKSITAMLHRRKGWAKCGAAWVDHSSGSISMSSLSSAWILSPFSRAQKAEGE